MGIGLGLGDERAGGVPALTGVEIAEDEAEVAVCD